MRDMLNGSFHRWSELEIPKKLQDDFRKTNDSFTIATGETHPLSKDYDNNSLKAKNDTSVELFHLTC